MANNTASSVAVQLSSQIAECRREISRLREKLARQEEVYENFLKKRDLYREWMADTRRKSRQVEGLTSDMKVARAHTNRAEEGVYRENYAEQYLDAVANSMHREMDRVYEMIVEQENRCQRLEEMLRESRATGEMTELLTGEEEFLSPGLPRSFQAFAGASQVKTRKISRARLNYDLYVADDEYQQYGAYYKTLASDACQHWKAFIEICTKMNGDEISGKFGEQIAKFAQMLGTEIGENFLTVLEKQAADMEAYIQQMESADNISRY